MLKPLIIRIFAKIGILTESKAWLLSKTAAVTWKPLALRLAILLPTSLMQWAVEQNAYGLPSNQGKSCS